MQFCDRLSKDHDLDYAIAGGDPSAHDRYAEMSILLADRGYTTIVTHGCDLSTTDLDTLAVNGGPCIQFSIPSLNRERFKYITGGGCLDDVITNIAKACSRNIPISISAVVSHSPSAEGDIVRLVSLADEARASRLILNRFVPSGRGEFYEKQLALSDDRFSELMEVAAREAKSRDLKVYMSRGMGSVRPKKVDQPKISITKDGLVRVCSMAASDIGTVLDEPDDIFANYVKFWSSEAYDENCRCSMYA